MTNIMNFEHAAFGQVRTLNKDGEPWFVAKDIAEVLGYSNTRDAIGKQCKAKASVAIHDGSQNRNITIIPERDLYRLIMKSKLPQAERFEEWVVGEVLPSTRKHGGYVHAKVEDSLEEIMARGLVAAQQALKRVEEQRDVLEAKIAADKPKVLFTEAIEVSDDTIFVRDMAKLIQQATGHKTGQQRFYKWLRENGYLIKRGSDKNMPTQYGMDLGLFEIMQCPVSQPDAVRLMRTTKVTGKGQTYFINKFRKLTRTQ